MTYIFSTFIMKRPLDGLTLEHPDIQRALANHFQMLRHICPAAWFRKTYESCCCQPHDNNAFHSRLITHVRTSLAGISTAQKLSYSQSVQVLRQLSAHLNNVLPPTYRSDRATAWKASWACSRNKRVIFFLLLGSVVFNWRWMHFQSMALCLKRF